MARANRHYLPGLIWHITHRCHRRQYLLKFARDRRTWIGWLFEARKRFGLSVLDYMVTSNHIHLLVYDQQGKNVIPQSMQLIAGRCGQEYNQRKNRSGAYWEDRYHATAVESDEHLRQCLTYIDLNMVRAGTVSHPKQWPDCGFREIQNPRERFRIVDWEQLMLMVNASSMEELQRVCRRQVEEALIKKELDRQAQWSESLAVGSHAYIENIRKQLGIRARGRGVFPLESGFQLREKYEAYRSSLEHEKGVLSLKNERYWDLSHSY